MFQLTTEQAPVTAKSHSTKRVHTRVIKRRIREYMKEHQPCKKQEIYMGVQGNSSRLQKTVNLMLTKGEIVKHADGLVLGDGNTAPTVVERVKTVPQPVNINLGAVLMVSSFAAAGAWLALIAVIVRGV